MKLKLLMDIMVASKAYVAGSVVEVNDEFGQELLEGKKAEKYDAKTIKVVEDEKPEAKTEVKIADRNLETKDVKVESKSLSPEVKLANTLAIARAVKTNQFDKLTVEQKTIAGQGETTAADGGALVDNEIVQGIWSNAVATGQILPNVQSRPVGKNFNTLELKQLNESSGRPSDYNGVVLAVSSEGATISAQKLAYKAATAAVNKLTALIPMTTEILEDDAHGILAFTEQQVGAAYGIKIDEEILYGTDSLLTAAVGNSGSRAVTLTNAASPTAAELAKMYMSQIRPDRAEWYMGGMVYQNLITLESTLGQPVLVPNYAVSPFGTLFGRPVHVVSAMLGTDGEAGTIGFCDWADGYAIGTKGGVKMARSIHVYFDTDQEAFRWTLRIAGLPTKATTMLLNDGRTVSPLVFGNDS